MWDERCDLYDLPPVGNCLFPLVWFLLLPLVSRRMFHYPLDVFALLASADDVMAGVIHGEAFLVGESLVVLPDCFIFPLASSLWAPRVSAMSVSGLLVPNFIHSLCCRISVFPLASLLGQESESQSLCYLTMSGKTFSQDNGLACETMDLLCNPSVYVRCFILSLHTCFMSKT